VILAAECEILISGPSSAVDTACSSSFVALDQALRAIRSGQCDAAVVGGTNLCLHPMRAAQFHKLGMLSPCAACKSLDISGNAESELGASGLVTEHHLYYSRLDHVFMSSFYAFMCLRTAMHSKH